MKASLAKAAVLTEKQAWLEVAKSFSKPIKCPGPRGTDPNRYSGSPCFPGAVEPLSICAALVTLEFIDRISEELCAGMRSKVLRSGKLDFWPCTIAGARKRVKLCKELARRATKEPCDQRPWRERMMPQWRTT